MRQETSKTRNKRFTGTRSVPKTRTIDKYKTINKTFDSITGRSIKTRRSITTESGFNINDLIFKSLPLYEAFQKGGGDVYSKDILKGLLDFIRCARHLPEYKKRLSVKKEWLLPEVDELINDVITDLKEKNGPDVIIFSDHNNSEASSFLGGLEKPYILFKDEAGCNTGALFLNEFEKCENELDREIMFKGLRLLNKMNIGYWEDTTEWDELKYQVDQYKEGINNNKYEGNPDDIDAYQEWLDELGLSYIKPALLNHIDEWSPDIPIRQYIEKLEVDISDFDNRIKSNDDLLSVWLMAISYLHSINFNLHDYTYADSGDCPAINNYSIFLDNDSEFISAYDQFMDGYFEHYPGIVKTKVITPKGILRNNNHLPVEIFMSLIFTYNPAKNTFYGYDLTYKDVDTIASHINLSERQKSILCGIIDDYNKGKSRSF